MLTFGQERRTEYPRLRWVTFCLVFFAVPLLLVTAFVQRLWQEQEELRRVRVQKRYETILSRIARWENPVEYFTVLMREVQTRILSSPDQRAAFKRVFAQLKARFPGVLECVVFHGEGADRELSDGVPPNLLLKKFFRDVLLLRAKVKEPIRSSWNLYKAYFGPVLDPDNCDTDTLQLASYAQKRAFAFFSRPCTLGLFTVFFHQTRDWHHLPFIDRVNAHNRKGLHSPIALIDIGKKWRDQQLPPAFAGLPLDRLIAQFEVTPRFFLIHDDKMWFQRMVSPTMRLLTFVPLTEDPKIHRRRMGLLISVTTAFALGAVFSWLIMIGNRPWYLSIRLKLLFLFLFSVGMPLVIMGLNARDYVAELRFRLENQLQLDVEAALTSLDKKFPQQLGYFQTTLQRFFGTPIPAHLPIRETSIQRIKQAINLLEPSEAQLIDATGESIIPALKDHESTQRTNKILKPIYQNLLKSINNSHDNEDFKSNQSARIVAAAGVDIDALYSDWAKSLGVIREIKFGERRAIQTFYPVLTAQGKAQYLVMFGWSHFSTQEKFLRRYLHQVARELPETEFWARSQEPEKPTHYDQRRDVPKSFRHGSMAAHFVARLMTQKQVLKTRVRKGGKTYLLTGLKGTNLPHYYLVAVSTDNHIQRIIDEYVWKIKWGSLGMILITITVGTFLARKFLEPVSELTSGVQALQNRVFDARIPVLDYDELGDLSKAFNDMMESMSDLEVARIVQESLFPSGTLAITGCSIYGTCQPATQVGGDYYDYFPLGEHRIGFLIGDVSGHGVAAAMVMSMAKATISNLGEGIHDPAAILFSLHQLLLKTLKRKRMMTCFLGIIDAADQTLTFANAGHNHPYHLRGKSTMLIEASSYPLGSRTRATYSNQTLELNPGDRLFFYTDGLIEAVAHDNEPIGYRRFEETLPTLLRDSPQATEQAVRQWHQGIVLPGPQADDITVLLVFLDPTGSGGRQAITPESDSIS